MKSCFLSLFLIFSSLTLSAQETTTIVIHDSLSLLATLHFSDNFDGDLSKWKPQFENKGSRVDLKNGKMEIETIRGCTVWFEELLEGPLMIEYDAVMIDEGGSLDRISDLNCFWMASDPYDPSGKFINEGELNGSLGDYSKLKLYYVGQGGRKNTTTRFRRYPGNGERPMLPEHDLRDAKYLLTGNTINHIRIIVYNNIIQYYRNNQLTFDFFDPEPQNSGYFGFRTTINHMTTDNFRVYRLSEIE